MKMFIVGAFTMCEGSSFCKLVDAKETVLVCIDSAEE